MNKHIGGQAVIEGVMMKGKNNIATAVRKKNKILIKKTHYTSLTERCKILKLPILRGIVNLFEMMIIGIKTLTWSADQQVGKEEKITKKELAVTMFISFGAVILLFIIMPYYVTKIFIKEPNLTFNLIDGLLRIIIFFIYLYVIGLMSDMKRVFQYHGAEHKAVNCFEADKKLTPANAKKYPKEHIRCGTSLLVIVIVISILLFSLIKDPRWFVNIPLRILLVPVIAGIGYEAVKLAARFEKNPLVKIVTLPGLWTQKFTTREPSEKQLQVAIKALNAVR
jgi:uncharacterized protein YqhQ